MDKIKVSTFIFLFLFVLFIWSRNGISPQLSVKKESSLISIFFDSFLLGRAIDTTNTPKTLKVFFSNQDLESPYFQGQPESEKNNIPLPSGNYDISFKIKNPFITTLFFEGTHPYSFYLAPYRHLSSGWMDPENILNNKYSSQVQVKLMTGIKWILWILLKPFPVVSALFLLIFILIKTGHKFREEKSLKFNHKIIFILPLFLAVSSFLWSRYLMNTYTLSIPHVPDSVSYVLLSKIISSGHFVMPLSDLPNFIPKNMVHQYLSLPWFTLRNDYFFIYYLLGHPAILAIGNLFGSIEVVPPIIGALCLILVFIISFRLTKSAFFSFLSGIILFASPFFQTQTIDYMSHNTAAFFILLSILPIFLKDKRLYILTGFFQGMLLNTRPLIFIASFVTILLYHLILILRGKKEQFKKILFLTLGFIPPVLIFLYYNYLTTGSIFVSPYLYHGYSNRAIFGADFKLGYGLLNTFSSLAVFSLFFLKNYYISFLPLLLSFILIPFYGKRILKIIFLQILVILLIGVWTLYDGNFFMYGPRFIYESVPVFSILYGVTFYYLYNLFKQRLYKFVIFFFLVIYFYNILLFQLSWLGVRKAEYSGIVFVPASIAELKNFNFTQGKFLKLYNKYKGQGKVFLMKKCANWWCTGEGVWLNDFPLKKSRPIFLTLPDNYNNEIPQTEIIDWEKL